MHPHDRLFIVCIVFVAWPSDIPFCTWDLTSNERIGFLCLLSNLYNLGDLTWTQFLTNFPSNSDLSDGKDDDRKGDDNDSDSDDDDGPTKHNNKEKKGNYAAPKSDNKKSDGLFKVPTPKTQTTKTQTKKTKPTADTLFSEWMQGNGALAFNLMDENVTHQAKYPSL